MSTKHDQNCIFCKIVKGELESSKIYEDKNYLVILDLFPITKGQAIIITKQHLDSNFAEVQPEIMTEITALGQKIAKKLQKALDSYKVGFVVEGLQVAHLHAKIYPFPKLNEDGSNAVNLTHSGEMADRGELDGLVKTISE